MTLWRHSPAAEDLKIWNLEESDILVQNHQIQHDGRSQPGDVNDERRIEGDEGVALPDNRLHEEVCCEHPG